MSVNITALGDLGKWDWNIFARVTSDIATGGAAELMWNKKTRKAITKGLKTVGKTVGKKVLCPVAEGITQGKTAEAAMKSGPYGTAAVVAVSAAKGLCPKKKVEEQPVVQEHWSMNPVVVGGAGLAFGLLLGALFSR